MSRAPWVVPFVAAPLAAFAAGVGAFTFDPFSQGAWGYFFLSRRIFSPVVDAASTLLAIWVFVPLAISWVFLRGRESFRF